MSLNPIKNYEQLRKRLGRFLDSKIYARDEIGGLIREIEPLGSVLIFGGMLRDLSLLGIAGFASDVDLVVRTNDAEGLDRILATYRSEKNRFGGYRIQLEKWQVDLWTFESTWAFKEELVIPKGRRDLCKTTFFDWDAIAFDVSDAKFFSVDGYIERINSQIIDINFESNPNPLGNVVKAFRFREKYDAQWSNRLSRYIFAFMQNLSSVKINEYEKRSHDSKYLEEASLRSLIVALEEHQKISPLFPFQFEKQKRLLG